MFFSYKELQSVYNRKAWKFLKLKRRADVEVIPEISCSTGREGSSPAETWSSTAIRSRFFIYNEFLVVDFKWPSIRSQY